MGNEEIDLTNEAINELLNNNFTGVFALAGKLKKCELHDEIYISECEFCKKEIENGKGN